MAASDTELIAQAKEGDRRAFTELVRKYDKRVLAIAFGFTRNADDAKDIHQEVFIRVYRSLNQFEERSEFATWLHRITTNVCLTYKTQKKPNVISLEEAIENEILEEPAMIATSSETANLIFSAIGKISPQQRLAFILKHEQGYKIKEIAEMMNCAEGTIKKHLFTAVERLREALRKEV